MNAFSLIFILWRKAITLLYLISKLVLCIYFLEVEDNCRWK